jgi:hypothetical protein
MVAMRNLFHGMILAAWAVAGVVFSVKVISASVELPGGLMEAGSFWLWFAGFTAVTTAAVVKTSKAWAPLAVHSLAFIALSMIPRVFPLSLLRLGLDLLQRLT